MNAAQASTGPSLDSLWIQWDLRDLWATLGESPVCFPSPIKMPAFTAPLYPSGAQVRGLKLTPFETSDVSAAIGVLKILTF